MKEFFRLVKKDLAQSAGFGVLAFLYIIFARLVTYVSAVSNAIEKYRLNPDAYNTPVMAAEDYMGTGNFWHMAVVVVLGCCFALLTCYYLHGRKTVDFYHSLPVKKTTVFGVKYVTGIKIFVLACSINYALMLGASLALGVLTPHIALVGFEALINGICGYIFIYSAGVLAGLLTATIVTHIVMGTIVMFILPVIVLLWQGWMYLFFVTYKPALPGWVYLLSPIVYFCERCIGAIFGGDSVSLTSALIMAVAAAVITVLDFFVCKLRRSEATGKALAFKELNEPLRIVFSLISGVIGGFIALVMFGANPTVSFLAGFFVVLVLSSLIIEIIFRFDFTAALRNKKQLLITVIMGCVVMGATFLSIKPYNTYVPKAEDIEYAAVSIPFFENGEYYAEKIDGRTVYSDNEEYIFKNMKITDGELLERLFTVCAEKYESLPLFTTSYDETGYYTGAYGDYNIDEDILNITLNVKCTLKNGKTYYRCYSADYDKIEDVLAELLENSEYKQALWGGFYNMDKESIKSAEVMPEYNFYNSQYMDLTPEDTQRLCEEISRDFENITLDELTRESPVCSIRFYEEENRYGRYENPSAAQINVYPSCENTIALLEDMGIKFYTLDETVENVELIEITAYVGDEIPTITFTDKDEIREILKCSGSADTRTEKYSVSEYDVEIKGGAETNRTYYYARFNTIRGVPEFVKERFEEGAESTEEQQ